MSAYLVLHINVSKQPLVCKSIGIYSESGKTLTTINGYYNTDIISLNDFEGDRSYSACRKGLIEILCSDSFRYAYHWVYDLLEPSLKNEIKMNEALS